MRRIQFAVLTVIAACAPALMAPAAGVAQNSAIDQYVEQVPSAGGNKPAEKPGGDQGGRPSSDGSAGGSSSGSGGSGGGSGDSATESRAKSGKVKDDKGKGGDSADVPASDDKSGGASDSAAELARANVPASVGTSDGGAFPVVALLILTALAVAAGAGWWQYSRRRGSPGGSADA